MNAMCKNGWILPEIQNNFGNDEESLKNCEKCDNLEYDNGIMTCKLIKLVNDSK